MKNLSSQRARHSLLATIVLSLMLPSSDLAQPIPATPSAAKPAPLGQGKVFLTTKEALALAFPKSRVKRHTLFLTKKQKEAAEKHSGEKLEKAIAYVYVAFPEDSPENAAPIGYAYFDTHGVRTLRETMLIAVDLEQRVKRLELCSFAEPQEYIPRAMWYAQFLKKQLNDELRLKRDIRGVAGATLTAVATTSAVRRVLGLHKLIIAENLLPPTGGTLQNWD